MSAAATGGRTAAPGPAAGRPPSAATLRRLRRAGGPGRVRTILRLAFQAYSTVLIVAILGGMLGGAAQWVRSTLLAAAAPPAVSSGVPHGVAAVVAAVCGLAGATAVAARLGPIGLSPAEFAWYASTPVDRRGLLRRPALAATGITVAVTAICALPLIMLTASTGASPERLADLAAATVLVGALIALLAAAVQSAGRSTHVLAVGAAAVALAAPAVLVTADLLSALRPQSGVPVPGLSTWPALGSQGAWLLAALAAAVMVAWAVVDRRLPALRAHQLRAAGGVGLQLELSLVALDVRQLAAAFVPPPTGRRRVGRRLLRLAAPGWRALAVADVVAALRRPGLVAVAVALAPAPAAVVVLLPPGARGGAFAALAVWTAMLAAGGAAALAASVGARRAAQVPSLDRLLPLSARTTAAVRVVVIAVLAVPVLAGAAALTGLTIGGADAVPGWLLLGALVGPGAAAAALRGTRWEPPDMSVPAIETPAGVGLPPGASSALRGLDVGLLATAPVALAVVAGPTPAVLAITAAASAATAALVVRSAASARPPG